MPLPPLIPLSEFTAPPAPTPQAMRSGLHAVWKWVRQLGRPAPPAHGFGSETVDWQPLEEGALDRVAPPPKWDAYSGEAVVDGLESWSQAEAGPLVIVQPPYSPLRQLVTAWATRREMEELQPPSRQELLAGTAQLSLPAPSGLKLVARLERFYLRHAAGLRLIRSLANFVGTERPSWLIVCDSWAWAFLARVCNLPSGVPPALTWAPFRGDDLGALLGALPASPPPRICLLGSEQPMFGEQPVADADSAPAEPNPVMAQLAARARGNPAVAWALWRRSLGRATDGRNKQDICVRPLESVTLPELPPGSGQLEAFCLHALLLHDGLPGPLLDALLPADEAEVGTMVGRLAAAGVIGREADGFRVAPCAYPTVRSFLSRDGLLTDSL